MDGAYAVLQRRHAGKEELSEEKLGERFPVGPSAGSLQVSISGLVEHWKAGKERYDQKTYDRHAKALGDFAAFLGHDDAARIQPGDLQRWLVSLSDVKKLAAKTINEGYRAAIKSCFAAGLAAGVLRTDPVASVKFKIKSDSTKRAARDPYSDNDAAKLLAFARKERGPLRWLPWLLAYTGARIGEIAQLYREDVRFASREEARKGGRAGGVVAHPQGRGGVYFLRITNEGQGQRLKNAASRREVPLHPALANGSFLEFVENVWEGEFLFPELTAGKYGNKGDGGSRVYRKWARNVVGIKDKRLTAHSWRHRFEDQLRHAGVPDDVRDDLTGHARQGMGSRYGRGHSLETKAAWLAKVPTQRVDRKEGKRS
ncbi:MAG TPA: site-specific integrase [Reyranella sp.]|nr:site-specific integrase [Reyranella sp.]